ncbi:MAG TPA: peptide chain release factor N(5)-glutamine methyltransferase, partial [Myxococcaceae bacterium]|nr:peptide chain release factor N(5)-glutamine methyltransferase [Myxococcaceae bacterium]
VLTWASRHFEQKGIDSPRLTAEMLLAHVLSCDRIRLYVDLDRPMDRPELAATRSLIERRLAREPTQYLTGRQHFYGRAFAVDPSVLIPRPETELLVEAVLRTIPKDRPARLLDLCTGSGCIAVTLAAERPRAAVWATDLSDSACEVARRNAEALGVADRVAIREGDLFGPVASEAPFDAIAGNPPYIARAQLAGLQAEVRREPVVALDGGQDGLTVICAIVGSARSHLRSGGWLALEIAEDQGPRVRELFAAAGFEDIGVEKDLARHDRLVVGRAP